MALLNEPQERSLAVTLERVREAVEQIERLDNCSQELEAKLGEVKKIINMTESEFRLKPIIKDTGSSIHGTLAVLWVTLEESRPAKLARYGAVDPELKLKLGPKIDRLIELVTEIRKLV